MADSGENIHSKLFKVNLAISQASYKTDKRNQKRKLRSPVPKSGYNPLKQVSTDDGSLLGQSR